MKRFALVLALVFAATCLIVGVSPAQEKTISLRFSTFFPPTHPLAVITNDWCKEVEKRTNGRVKVKQYGGATLTSPVQTYDSVVQGVVDAGNMVLGYTMGKFPLSEVLDYPLGYPNATVAHKLANAYYAKFKPKEFDDVKVMYFHGQTPGILHTKSRPVTKLEDLKGMKIRTQGTNAKFMQLLGGIPVAMPMGDAYDAINKGVADGIMCADEVLKSWKIGEVVKYTTQNYASAYTSIFLVAMNKNKWASIKPEDQKIIEQINTEWIDRSAKVWEQIDKEGQEFAKKRGIKVTKLSPEEDARWAAKAQPLYDEYVKNMKAKGLPGEEVLKFVRNFLKTNK
ncbi:MAG: C4-dicarboxylate-binding periplasmic protein precursor [Syntrophorhabdaceae bacterium PtaU1.Bin034]|nr:MAG: C4-dicarboxylate-binding periplasmic protein precursor [Syntrophorhabdaceae bacterium PtaU1.Bin034]